jgi:fructose-bisphosphate aldolase class II
MLATTAQILGEAHKGGYAVGAFNMNNMEIWQAIIAGPKAQKAPVIISNFRRRHQIRGRRLYFSDGPAVRVQGLGPVALHLDHGTHYDVIIGCIRHG